MSHDVHLAHSHVHGEHCGHKAVHHDDHLDYLHDDHLHSSHEGHYDEHVIAVIVNWVNIRTKMSVDGLCVRRFTQIFRG